MVAPEQAEKVWPSHENVESDHRDKNRKHGESRPDRLSAPASPGTPYPGTLFAWLAHLPLACYELTLIILQTHAPSPALTSLVPGVIILLSK